MKLYKMLFIMLFLILSSLTLTYSQDSIKVVTKFNDDQIDLNYLNGINSQNLGLRISSSYYLGERKSSKAIIPLMNVLHTDKSPEARVMAALSLFKIGDERGIYAVKQAIEDDPDPMVQKMCGIFYKMYLQNEQSNKKK